MKADRVVSGKTYRPRTAADLLMAGLRERLFDGGFAPGETVSIRKIAQGENVSVIPARDALRALVAEGALEFRDSRTIVVPLLDPATLEEIRFARMAVETELARRAFDALTGRVDELRSLDAKVSRALLDHDVPTYTKANRSLHFTIYRAAAAPVLLRMAETLWLRFGPSMRIVCEGFAGTIPSPDYHTVAIAALRSGDRAGFCGAMAADVAQGIAELERHILRQGGQTQRKDRP